MREGWADYEDLWQANCRAKPSVFQKSALDVTAMGIGASYYAFNRNEDEAQSLRNQLGLYLEGTRADLPFLKNIFTFPYGDVFFDFTTDPGTNIPFMFNSREYIPVDMNNNYDPEKGFGFQSKQMLMPNW
jgi:hypothetical protein